MFQRYQVASYNKQASQNVTFMCLARNILIKEKTECLLLRNKEIEFQEAKLFRSYLYRNNVLKEYYEIVDEARPLSGFFPYRCWFVYRNAYSNHETISNLPSFRAIWAFHNQRWKNKLLHATLYFLIFLLLFFYFFYFFIHLFISTHSQIYT